MNISIKQMTRSIWNELNLPEIKVICSFSKSQLIFSGLLMSVILSALSVVYVTNEVRALNADLQDLRAMHVDNSVEKAKLMLEKGSLLTQGRLAQIAQDDLGMVIPTSKEIKDLT